jgi:hypothetical protein
MIRFIGLLILTLVLTAVWVVTSVTMQISGQDYLNLTAPWWHVALHIAWFLSGSAASMLGVSMLVDRHSRRKLADHPPHRT